jgi:formamidopyrimidine-DNA glycosylase
VGDTAIVTLEVLDSKTVSGKGQAVAAAVAGRHIEHYGRRGKVLILRLDDGAILLLHPRMTGKLKVLADGDELPRHARLVFHLADERRLVFDDSRRFGRVELARGGEEDAGALLCRIGPDATSCDPAHLQVHLSRRRTPVKVFLLDQRVLAGVGNIYASEICYRCGLDPRTPCHSLKPAEVRRLAKETEKVLAEGIAHRGTTIADYRSVDGQSGKFQKRLAVYGREGEACRRRGCPGTVRKIVLSGRSTYFCSHCQRTGRTRK